MISFGGGGVVVTFSIILKMVHGGVLETSNADSSVVLRKERGDSGLWTLIANGLQIVNSEVISERLIEFRIWRYVLLKLILLFIFKKLR